jgi:hypothetical protein
MVLVFLLSSKAVAGCAATSSGLNSIASRKYFTFQTYSQPTAWGDHGLLTCWENTGAWWGERRKAKVNGEGKAKGKGAAKQVAT